MINQKNQNLVFQFMSLIEELPATAEKSKLMTYFLNCITEKEENKTDVQAEEIKGEEKIPELLAMKQCLELVPGLSYYKLRNLVIEGKIPSNWKKGQQNGTVKIEKK